MCHVRIFVLQQRHLKSSLNDVTLRHQHWDHLNLKAFWIPRIVLPQAHKTDAKFKRQICHSHSHGCDHFHSQSAYANQGTLTKRSPWNVRRLWCPCHGLRAEQAFSFVAATSVTSLCSELERNGSKWAKWTILNTLEKECKRWRWAQAECPGSLQAAPRQGLCRAKGLSLEKGANKATACRSKVLLEAKAME